MVVRDACGREGYTHPIQGTADGSCREWSNLLDIQMRPSVSVLLCDPGATIIQHRRCFQHKNENCSLTFFVLVLRNTLHLGCSRLVAQEKLQMVEVVEVVDVVEVVEVVDVVEVVALGFNVGTSPTFLQQAALCPSTLPSSSRL